MDAKTAKTAVAEALSNHGINFGRLRARSVSFSDLARNRVVSVRVEGINLPDPRIREVKKELPNGVILDLPSVVY